MGIESARQPGSVFFRFSSDQAGKETGNKIWEFRLCSFRLDGGHFSSGSLLCAYGLEVGML